MTYCDSPRGCDLPRFFKRRFRHRPWVCDCGRAWRVQPQGAMDGWMWIWEPWRVAELEREANRG